MKHVLCCLSCAHQTSLGAGPRHLESPGLTFSTLTKKCQGIPLPWKPCAGNDTLLCRPLLHPTGSAPLPGPRRGKQVASTKGTAIGSPALRSNTLKGLHKWQEACSACTSSRCTVGTTRKSGTTRERPRHLTESCRLNRSDDTLKTHNCFETNSLFMLKKKKRRERATCLFILSEH